ncbi:MAG TPA: alginate export family protein [Gemmataceae bacterium]
MPFGHRGMEGWILPLLGAVLLLMADRPSFAQQQSSPASLVEPFTPDSPERTAARPTTTSKTKASSSAVSSSSAASKSSTQAAAQVGPGGGAPDEAAPTLLGPSGAGSGAVETAPAVSGEEAPVEEAPTIAGPSGAARPEAQPSPYGPWWTRVPNVQPFPPPGNTVLPPTGPGYYTFLELLRGDYRQVPPRYAYPRFGIIQFSFFNADWRYLDNAGSQDRDVFDFLKRLRFLDDFMFTTGGEFRYRHNNEVDSRLSGANNVYELTRTRVYGDLWFRDLFRIYGELINAQSFNQDLPPQAVDQYNPNFLNLFADAKVWTFKDQPVYLRGGRQELLYGSQRLISPLDWANTRRTFQGGKVFWQNEKFSLDGFVVQPVTPSANSFASVVWQQVFSGAWGSYRPVRGQVIDLYYLNFQDSTLTFSGVNGIKGPQNNSTVGSRWYGDKNNWLWDAEGMIQFGRFSNQGIMANAFTMGGGYYFSKWFLHPTIWVYYDHASGQPGPPGSTSTHQTFNQLFPFGHYYFGMTDLIGRQNINDFHVDLSFFPLKWWTVWAQYHVLRLDSPFDALYSSAGVVERIDPTGKAGINVGEVFTIINNFTIDLHQSVFIQYSHLYAGDFLHRTGNGRSPDILWAMYSFRW